ncbi:MAG: hypothetical protein ACKVHU_20115 [Acidimicrobiales bacterium]
MKKTIAIVTIAAIALIGTATTASALTPVGLIVAVTGAQANQTPNIALSNTTDGGLNEISGIVVRPIGSFTYDMPDDYMMRTSPTAR